LEFLDMFFNSLLHCANDIICILSPTPGYSYLIRIGIMPQQFMQKDL
jgi:hypothetical protein